jgi:bifunctional non-homologous end joining protein LigD
VATKTATRKSPVTNLAEYRKKRDFSRTAEPSGDAPVAKTSKLRFVIQKHAASHLHYDLRLELDGVMKSWAVPKGPSNDPSVKRLAMQVEDHPIAYNTFEGTIPKGEYGGGTVMLWDNGTYTADGVNPNEAEEKLRAGYAKGDLKITFFGERMKGSWALVRMKSRDEGSSRPQWLFIKHRDEYASTDDLTGDDMTSVTTGRTMEEIAGGKSKVWHSNRTDSKTKPKAQPKSPVAKAEARSATLRSIASSLEPMYATIGSEIPGDGWTFEPKYDGIRVLAFVTDDDAVLITRNGKDKSAQFPEIVEALRAIAAKKKKDFVLDGEIVALIDGEPGRYQDLQSRMHVKESNLIERHRTSTPSAFILFDILVSSKEVLIHEPWSERRKVLVKELGKSVSGAIRLTESIQGDGAKMLALAHKEGW